MTLKAILFDLDGTLRDTREVIYPAFEHALNVHTGRVHTRAEIKPYVHHHVAVRKALAPHIDEKAFTATYAEKLEAMRPTTILYEGADKLLRHLHKKGYRLGVVTSATTAAIYLSEQGLDSLFDVIVGGNDTTEHKPSPIPVLRALELLHVKPTEAIMVGDLYVDIESALNAGIKIAVGITHGFGDEGDLQEAGASYVIHKLEELTSIIEKIEATHA